MGVEKRQRSQREWDESNVRALRRRLGYTQQELARELGVRQQTVSEWETGVYRPRGASRTLLNMIAERAQFQYQAGPAGEEGPTRPGESHERGVSKDPDQGNPQERAFDGT